MKNLFSSCILSVAFLATANAVPEGSLCKRVAVDVAKSVDDDPAKVLLITSAKISENPGCACDVVKVSIRRTSASPELVAAIVEAAGRAAPDQLTTIVNCAFAAAPDASAQIIAAAQAIDPNVQFPDITQGPGNPLDAPGGAPGTPGIPIVIPPTINPPVVTDINPPGRPPGRPPVNPPGRP